MLAVTDDETVNLEIALVAKDANPSVRVVARVFDHDLASRVDRRLQLGATRSVSMLAAPGRSLRQLEEPGASRILAWSRSSGTNWQWGHLDHAVAGNKRIAVVATRAGLARLLRVTLASAAANQA